MFKDVSRRSVKKSFTHKKMAIGFVICVCALLVIAVHLIYQVGSVLRQCNDLYQHPIVLNHSVKSLKGQVRILNLLIAEVLNEKSHNASDKSAITLNNDIALIENEYTVLINKGSSIRKQLDENYQLFNQWKMIKKDIFILLNQQQVDQAKVLLDTQAQTKLAQLQQNILSIESNIEAQVREYEVRYLEITRSIKISASLLSLFALLCIIYFVYEFWQIKVTNIKRHNRTLGLIDEHILIAILDKQGCVEDVSGALCKFLGCWKEELIDSPTKFFLSTQKKDQLLEKNILNMITQGKEWRGEISFTNANGKTIWAESSILPNFDESYQLIGYTNILQDLTAKKQANMDKLTGLLNRRSYDDIFADQISGAVRNHFPLTLAVLDIDYFKRFNDQYGHPEGDIALQNLSAMFAKCMHRPTDFVFRIGGEEFAIIMSGLDEQKSLAFLDSIKKQVEALKIANKNSSVSPYLTVSIGAAVLLEGAASERELYKCADLALYQAKLERNKLVVTALRNEQFKEG
jgi:diguanylate cyclase (GGDEF)-like protein/PAS domain S-box-containing protein